MPDNLVTIMGYLEYPEFAVWIKSFLEDASHPPVHYKEHLTIAYFSCLQLEAIELLPQLLTGKNNHFFGERREATLWNWYEIIHDPKNPLKLTDPIYQEQLRKVNQILLENLWNITNPNFAKLVDAFLYEAYPEDYPFCIERETLLSRTSQSMPWAIPPFSDYTCWEIKRLFFLKSTMQIRFPNLKMKYRLKGYMDSTVGPGNKPCVVF